MSESLKIVRLSAENVKRLTAVEIKPDGNLVVVTGKNSQGKTSVLDSIWLGIGGGSATKQKEIDTIIRNGEGSAVAELDLGDYLVKRRWWIKESGEIATDLKVSNKDGAVFQSPQKMLDGMLSTLSFDPLAFAKMDGKKQVAMLVEAIGKGDALKELDEKREKIYSNRTDVNRELKSLEAKLESVELPEDADTIEPVSVAELTQQLEDARDHNSEIAAIKNEHTNAVVEVNRLDSEATEVAESIGEIKTKIEELEKNLAEKQDRLEVIRESESVGKEKVDALQKKIDNFQHIDTTEIREKLGEAESINEKCRKVEEYAQLENDVAKKQRDSDELTDQIAEIDKQKREIIEKGELPVDGLDFNEDGIKLNGVPLVDCSSSEKMRLAVGIAVALNPKLRVLRVKDGALLDSDAMENLAGLAAENDFQIWIERVDDSTEGAIIIEDGHIKGAELVEKQGQ